MMCDKQAGGRSGSAKGGFTLIELLLVIAIIAILAALLLPSIKQARISALTSGSSGNLRQIHLLFANYLSGHDGAYPTARGLHLPEERHWRRVVWEHNFGAFAGDPPAVMRAMQTSPYAKVMWCPLMVSRHGQEQHPFGRGSYGINRFFMDPTWGGGFRSEGSMGLVGVEEPYIMSGTLHPADARFGTDAHIDSAAYPYDTAWANLAYEYGANRDTALGLFIDGHVESIPRERGFELDDALRNPADLR